MKSASSIEDYIEAALKTARYEKIDDGTRLYAELPGFPGAWADGQTQADASRSLKQVLRGWVQLQLERGRPLPKLKGLQRHQLSLA